MNLENRIHIRQDINFGVRKHEPQHSVRHEAVRPSDNTHASVGQHPTRP